MRFLLAVMSALTGLIAFTSVSFAQTPQATQAIPLDAYGELPEVERAVMSPSGNRIAVITTVDAKRILLALENQTDVIGQFAVGDMKVRDILWAGEDKILLVASKTQNLGVGFTTDKAEIYTGMMLSLNAKDKAEVIFGGRRNLVDAIFGNYGIRKIDGRYYGFYGAIELKKKQFSRASYVFDHGRPYLYRVDLQDMTTQRISNAAAPGKSKDWLVGADGKVAATLDIDDTQGTWVLRGTDTKPIAKGKNPSGRTWLVGLGYDGTSVILSDRLSGRTIALEYPLAGGEPKPFLPGIDAQRLYFSDSTGHLIGYLEDGANPKPVFKDPAHSAAAVKVRKAFAQYEMDMIDWTDDLKQFLVRTSGNLDSGTWYAVDIDSLKANAVAYERMAIGPEHVGPISTFEYTASDGTKLDGILTLPPGKEAKNLPLVMLPHGGPHSYDAPEFDWWAQAYASRGYAVFQPNFRGSTHKSQSFRRAGYGEWGGKMQSDKSDGLKALAEKGIIDPKRACIVGASYGGYAALAGVTLEQGIYRCAVAVAPVADIKQMYREDYRATGNDRTTKIALLEQLGPRENWDALSPLRAGANADAPIMLIHGKDDVVVPYSHSVKMADKLKDAGKPYEMVTLEGEDHWLSLSATRKQMLKAAVGFVEKHNPAN